MPQPRIMWIIFKMPNGFPDPYVARRWIITGQVHATEGMLTADTLEELRAKLPYGLTREPRRDDGDEMLIETWR